MRNHFRRQHLVRATGGLAAALAGAAGLRVPVIETRPQRAEASVPPEPGPGRTNVSGGWTTNYVGAEICIVVSALHPTDGRPTDGPPRYDVLRRALNAVLAQVLRLDLPLRKPAAGWLRQGVRPAGLQEQRAEKVRELLVPLDRTPASVQLQATGTTLHFYRIALPPRLVGDGNDRNVRELVNLINWEGGAIASRLSLAGTGAPEWRIEAATPNWLASAAGWDDTDCGPATLPAPIPPTDAGRDWTFTIPALDALAARQGGASARAAESVLVAVLDTCLTPEAFKSAGATFAAQGNTLWQTVKAQAEAPEAVRRFHVDSWPSMPAAALGSHLSHYRLNWGEQLARGEPDGTRLRVVDHGLFVAGIIRDITPGAEIHLLRVLNDYGVGDLWALATVLAAVPDLLQRRHKRCAVVNLSLVSSIPTGVDMVEHWLGAPRGAPDGVPPDLLARLTAAPDVETYLQENGHGEVYELLRATTRGLTELVDALRSGRDSAGNMLVVAAAGNDNEPNGSASFPPGPRYPARYDRVLGVASVNYLGAPSAFSNRGDVPTLGTGVATFGGDAPRAPGESSDTARTIRNAKDGVAGLCSASPLPMSDGENSRGWALWAGTSFAAPVAAAVAACLWEAHPETNAGAMLDRIIGVADQHSPSTSAPTQLHALTIRASQHPK